MLKRRGAGNGIRSAGPLLLAVALLAWLAAPASAQGAVGQADYDLHCANCHGLSGLGDGPLVPFIGLPPPANLSICDYRLDPDLDGIVGTDDDLFLVIRDGPVAFDPFANVSMTPFGLLLTPPARIDDVITYIRSLEPIPCPEPGRPALSLATASSLLALRTLRRRTQRP